MPLVFGRSILGFVVVDTGVTWTDPDIANASYDSVSFSISTQEAAPQALYVKPDGTKFYIIGTTTDTVYQYSLSTAWDMSTASYDSVSFSVASQEAGPGSLFFKDDGTKMYIAGSSGDDINEYTLSTAWDVSTASFDQATSISANVATARGLYFKDDGTKVFVVDQSGQDISEFSLSTAWDSTTISYTQAFSISTQDTNPQAVYFNPDGTKMFVAGNTNTTVFQYSLSTAWDVSTASYDSISFSISSQDTGFTGLFFKSDGSKMYTTSNVSDTIFQYSTVAPAWTNPDLATASYDSVSFSVATQETSPVEITFNDDGSKMYIMGLFSRTIYQYSLSTEFDISTASYNSVSFSVASQLSLAGGFVFNNDGTKLYATGEGGDAIFQYSLSTAYDISTASYDSVSLDVSSQDTGPNAIEISTDGTKMYIIGWQNDTVFQYTLTSAFDLSTASYANKSFSVSTSELSPFALRFNPNGTKMYVLGTSQDKVRQYSLSTAFDVSTASYDSIEFSVNSQESLPHAMAFKNDGSKLYIVGQTNDTVYQYST